MKQHRLGLNSSRHVHHQSNTVTHGWRQPYAYQISMKARIVSNNFLVRAQDWLLIPTGEVVKSLPSYFTNICPHLTSLWRNDSLSKMLLCRLGHLHDHHTCPKCSGLKQCRYCPTEYQIDHKSFGKQGIVIFITRWLDLGAGSTHLDPKWQIHVWKAAPTGSPDVFVFAAGSIQSAFELQEHFSFESVMTSHSCRELLRR